MSLLGLYVFTCNHNHDYSMSAHSSTMYHSMCVLHLHTERWLGSNQGNCETSFSHTEGVGRGRGWPQPPQWGEIHSHCGHCTTYHPQLSILGGPDSPHDHRPKWQDWHYWHSTGGRTHGPGHSGECENHAFITYWWACNLVNQSVYMYIEGGVDSPAGPANAIPLSKTVWQSHTTIFSQSHALIGHWLREPSFFPRA